jgi:predicted transcriptional regulator of viral defense system
MNIAIEKNLQQYKTHIIDHATLATILINNGYNGINDKINKLKRDGLIETLKRGLYLHKSPFSKTYIAREIIANTLLSPSYISFDYALYFHGLIPESVYDVTSATTKRSKNFKTASGRYSFRQVKKELYSIGIKIESSKNGNFIIASKEKALCDKIYYTKDIQITSKKAMIEFLKDDLRIDLDELQDCDIEIFTKYYEISKSKKIKFLIQVLEGIV